MSASITPTTWSSVIVGEVRSAAIRMPGLAAGEPDDPGLRSIVMSSSADRGSIVAVATERSTPRACGPRRIVTSARPCSTRTLVTSPDGTPEIRTGVASPPWIPPASANAACTVQSPAPVDGSLTPSAASSTATNASAASSCATSATGPSRGIAPDIPPLMACSLPSPRVGWPGSGKPPRAACTVGAVDPRRSETAGRNA